eukprot:scaffold32650_cov33-Attheya_sp.AAC.1
MRPLVSTSSRQAGVGWTPDRLLVNYATVLLAPWKELHTRIIIRRNLQLPIVAGTDGNPDENLR